MLKEEELFIALRSTEIVMPNDQRLFLFATRLG
jgi:hypothetical protein